MRCCGNGENRLGTHEPLTTSRIANTQPAAHDIWLSDSDGSRGFGRLVLRISPRGARHFYFKVSVNGDRRVIPLGPYSKDSRPNHLTLNQAREAARQVLASIRTQQEAKGSALTPSAVRSQLPTPPTHAAGDDSAHAQQAPAVATSDSSPGGEGTLEELCAQYVQHLSAQGKVSANETSNRLRLHLNGTPLGGKAAAMVTAKEIAAHLRAMVSSKKARTAGLLRASISAAYAVALDSETNPSVTGDWSRFKITSNPVRDVASLSKHSKPRLRTLTSHELGYFWPMLHDLIERKGPNQFSDRFARLTILLGGQRCQQLARVQTKDVDLDEGLVTLLDSKGRRDRARVHRIPISKHAQADLDWFLQFARDSNSPNLFPGTDGPNSVVNNGTISTRVRKISRILHARHNIAKFSYSDFRRTTQTGMASLGIPLEVVNQILSHGLGGIVGRHYNFHEYRAEMLSALETWGNHLASLDHQTHGNRS